MDARNLDWSLGAELKMSSELQVITKAKALCEYVMTVTQKSPKAFRFTFVQRMQNLALDVVECLFRANETFVGAGAPAGAAEQRLELQHRASTSLKLLTYVAEMAMRQGCLLMKQYEQISVQSLEVGNMIGAWIASDRKRFGSHEADGVLR